MAYCSNCGAQISDRAVVCVKCGVSVIPRTSTSASDDSTESQLLRLVIPIGRSGWAIVAGYLGLFSLLPFVGLLAILFGILAVIDIQKHPQRHGLGRAWFGIIVGAISTVAWFIHWAS